MKTQYKFMISLTLTLGSLVGLCVLAAPVVSHTLVENVMVDDLPLDKTSSKLVKKDPLVEDKKPIVQVNPDTKLTLNKKSKTQVNEEEKVINEETGSAQCEKDNAFIPIREGYVFKGWYLDKGYTKEYNVKIPVEGELVLYAKREKDNAVHTLIHQLQELDGTYKTYEIETNVEDNPKTYTGYATGVKSEGGDDGIVKVQITNIGDNGREIIYKYARNKYQVNVVGDEGIESISGTGVYLYGIPVKLNVKVKKGYSFLGYENELGLTGSFNMPGQNIEIIAKTKAISYAIQYNLKGGIMKDAKKKYTKSDATFKLGEPIRTGYNFVGWTGTELNKITKDVEIKQGSMGKKSYTANWERKPTLTYNVVYKLERLDGKYSTGDIRTYTGYETQKLSAPRMNFTGYQMPKLKTIELKENNQQVEYEYKRKQYTLDVKQVKGIKSVIGTGTYKFGEKVKLLIGIEDGYKIMNTTGTYVKTISMPKKNTKLSFNPTLIQYTIRYSLNGGVANNLTGYTKETPTFKLNTPVKSGYNFVGWEGIGLSGTEKDVYIRKGMTGDRMYIAKWIQRR